ncbi:MAG: Holliday junction resolvase RuvX [Deltaproteobacteria bacterium]|nr:MAG: Holliday junction resolvase RuvX [Deltaproteobacteria bacterium]
MRALGLDVGARRIGVALGDLEHGIAMPHGVVERAGIAQDVLAVRKLASELDATVVVVGRPLELDGRVGHRARRVQAFADALAEDAGDDLSVEAWDERFSTHAAERTLLAADVSRSRRKRTVDALAAQHILQGWIDAQRRRQQP